MFARVMAVSNPFTYGTFSLRDVHMQTQDGIEVDRYFGDSPVVATLQEGEWIEYTPGSWYGVKRLGKTLANH